MIINCEEVKECVIAINNMIDIVNKAVGIKTCSEEEAKKALRVLKSNKVRLVPRDYVYSFQNIKTEICCERCGASVENSEQLTSMPILRDYNNNQNVSDQLGNIDVCPNCLIKITGICNTPF